MLKGIEENKDYDISEKSITSIFETMLSELKKGHFVHEDTSLDIFIAIFKKEKLDPSDLIIWIGSIKELQWFISAIVYESEKIVVVKNDIWLITIKCFVDKDGNSFTDSQLRNASGKRLQRKEQVKGIVAKMNSLP